MINKNLYTYFEQKFLRYSNRSFLVSDHRTLRYDEIHNETGRYVSMFTEMQINKGDRIVVQVEKSIEAVLLYLACLRYGAIYIPLNPAYTKEEVEYFLQDSDPTLFVCIPERESSMRALATEIGIPNLISLGQNVDGSIFDKLMNLESSQHVANCSEDDLAAILYTSGTTGRSKGAMLTHHNLLSNALILLDYWCWDEDDVLLHALPIFHVHGLFVALHCALLNSSKVIFLDRFDTKRIIKELPNSTVMMGVPTFYVRLLRDNEFNKEKCSNMRLFISGSAPLLPETFYSFESLTGKKILERYGMTETGMLTSNPYNGDRIAGTVGYLLPTVKGRISNQNGQPVSDEEIGILEVKGPNIFTGYWGMPEKTASEFRSDGYFVTGDMASIDNTGRISIVGREKDLVISGGYNVYPKEIESILDEISGVNESCVIGLTHVDFGEAVTALIVEEKHSKTSEKEIFKNLKDKLAKYKQPKAIMFIDELPRNTMGKVQKNVLRLKYKEYYN
ncbi:MAG: AMP-binding protein [Paracoccaceae bacterium]|nr:AMP-binding protein [Paracoccaceae bacterium]